MKVREFGFSKLHTIKQSQNIFFSKFNSFNKIENIETEESFHRILATDIIAEKNLPGYKRAAMDGFAIIAENSYGASETSPLQLKIVGNIIAGETVDIDIKSGQAVKISTGAMVPNNATGIIKLEDCEIINDNTLEIYLSIPPGRNIADKDEDVKIGDLILKKYKKLKPWDISMLISLQIYQIPVYSQPNIFILSTGDEIIAPQNTIQQGQIIDSNKPALISWLKFMGCNISKSVICKDNMSSITQSLNSITDDIDLIITTGGTSVGSKDFMAEIIENLGELYVHGVAIRPGKPLALGSLNIKNNNFPIIALPGYPLAAFINFHLFVSPLIQNWTHQDPLLMKKTHITLGEKIPSKVGSTDFVRLIDTPDGIFLNRITGAGILSSLVKSNYLLEIPYDLEGHNKGDIVEVYIINQPNPINY